jgi:TolB-like protein
MSFFEELKRRNVFRVGIAYGVAAWVLLQVADLVLENINAPEWVIQAMMMMVGLGFIAALVIAWAYEMTPEGIKKEADVDRSLSVSSDTGRKMDRIIIGFLVVAVAVLLFRQSGDEPSEPQTTTVSNETEVSTVAKPVTEPDRKSIAVLPFVNMSSDPEQEYFSDGITEEILNRLAKIPDLQVAARTSVFSFKGQKQDIREVAELLGVATMLEGSVRRDGEQVRITAQLIRASDGFHLWSETYDRKIESIFAVQDEISQRIAEALQVSLGITDGSSTANVDPEVYDLYLQGRALHRQRGAENLLKALTLFKGALDIDPEFAPAWAGLSHSLNVVTAYASREEVDELGDVDNQSLQAARKALELDPNLAAALHAVANNHLARFHWSEAEKYYDQALALDPESTDIMEDYGHFLLYSWQTEEARQVADRMIALDPYVPVFRYMAMRVYHTLGDIERWGEHIEAATKISAELFNVQIQQLFYLLTKKDFESAREFAGHMNLKDWTTPEAMHSMVDWVANPSTEPTAVQMDALSFFQAGYLVAGKYSLWLDRVLDSEYDAWEDVLVYLSHLSSFENEEQFVSLHANPRVKKWLQMSGLPDYWREIGWPERCRPLGDDDFVCE